MFGDRQKNTVLRMLWSALRSALLNTDMKFEGCAHPTSFSEKVCLIPSQVKDCL